MKYPICGICLKNDILCDSCATKAGENLIKKDEIEMFKKLDKLTKKYTILKDAKVDRVIDSQNMLLILADRENASKIIGKDGGMIMQLGKSLGKRVRVVANMSNLEDFVKEMFFSANVLGINVVYGERDLYKIRLPQSEKEILPIDPEKFSKVANSVFGVDAELVFE